MDNPETFEIKPEDTVSIGAWYLLLDLRQVFCKHLYDDFFKTNVDNAQILFEKLFENSLRYWKQICSGLKNPEECEQIKSFIKHLENLKSGVSENVNKEKWISFFEDLIIPYVISTETANPKKVRPWFPNAPFLEFYESNHSQNDNPANSSVEVSTRNQSLIMLAAKGAFSDRYKDDTDRKEGTLQDALPPASESENTQERLGSGMRALQTKLIGAYDAIFTKKEEDKLIDKLAGNASALLYAIQEENQVPLGLVCFSSPLLNFYHELLLIKSTELRDFVEKAVGIDRYSSSIFICLNVLPKEDKQFFENLNFERGGVSRSEGGKYLHLQVSNEKKSVDLIVCNKCGESKDYCIFQKMDSWLMPTMGTFLRGLRNMANRQELELVEKRSAETAHVINKPFRTIISDYYANLDSIISSGIDAKKFINLGAELNIISSMLDSALRKFSKKTAKTIPRLGNKSNYTDISAVMDSLNDLRFFEEIISGIVCTLVVPRKIPDILVFGNEYDWYAIFYTLLDNASKYSRYLREKSPGKEAEVTIIPHFPKSVSEKFSLEIRNTSLKLTKGEENFMTEALRYGNQPVKTEISEKSGSGLGLITVKELTANYGFNIDYEQDPETFEVSIIISNVPVKRK